MATALGKPKVGGIRKEENALANVHILYRAGREAAVRCRFFPAGMRFLSARGSCARANGSAATTSAKVSRDRHREPLAAAAAIRVFFPSSFFVEADGMGFQSASLIGGGYLSVARPYNFILSSLWISFFVGFSI